MAKGSVDDTITYAIVLSTQQQEVLLALDVMHWNRYNVSNGMSGK